MSVPYEIVLHAQSRPFPHYWEFSVGSCHAATLLREDVRQHVRKAHLECGFRYLRFHGLFNDDMSVYFVPMMGEPIISFYNIDSVFDFLLENGMKPFIELGFMPTALASGTQELFHYKANVTMPRDDTEWQRLITLFAEHLIDRYGLAEVSQWFFEVWNEPNLRIFFDGTQEDYFHLYEVTARALKSVHPALKVGGPATSVNAWIPEFKTFCGVNNVPCDFITTHHYPSDDPFASAGMNGPGVKGHGFDKESLAMIPTEQLQAMIEQYTKPKENTNPADVLTKMAAKAAAEAAPLPLYYTEWNGSKEYDTSYQAAFIAKTIADNEGLVKGYSFWTVSDIFEELGMQPGPFKNTFGLLTNHGVAKPSYRVFEALHQAGTLRLETPELQGNVGVLALSDGSEATILIWNHDLDRRTVKMEEFDLILKGVSQVWYSLIDEDHCNPERAWKEMGAPEYLTKNQVLALHRESGLKNLILPVENETCSLDLQLAPESVCILHCRIS